MHNSVTAVLCVRNCRKDCYSCIVCQTIVKQHTVKSCGVCQNVVLQNAVIGMMCVRILYCRMLL